MFRIEVTTSTKLGDDWSNSKEMATVFRNPRWRVTAILKSTLPALPVEAPLQNANS